MPSLNIHLPDDVHRQAVRWRRKKNLSAICTRALREELDAAEAHRTAQHLFRAIRPVSASEAKLAAVLGLADVRICRTPQRDSQLREAIGRAAAEYLASQLGDGATLGIGGGRQMWCMVERLRPRPIRVMVHALGFRQSDPRLLNAHPNTLATLVWLLFTPRAQAQLVGAASLKTLSEQSFPTLTHGKHVVVTSCAQFEPDSDFGRLLGARICEQLLSAGVIGDAAYHFFNAAGRIVEVQQLPENSIIPQETLAILARRDDSRVVLAAGGAEKWQALKIALTLGWYNALVTDSETAKALWQWKKRGVDDFQNVVPGSQAAARS
jgi:DNA-binding transcriptional regulator LsrR (DeoR family)